MSDNDDHERQQNLDRDRLVQRFHELAEQMIDSGSDPAVVAEAMTVVANGYGRQAHGPTTWRQIVERCIALPYRA